MAHAYQALLQPDGRLQFIDAPPAAEPRGTARRVLVTFAEAAANAPTGAATGETPTADAPLADWQRHTGVLATSAHWNADPLAVQEAMRREWD